MKKTLIALAVASFSFNAAAVDLNTGEDTLSIAKEAVIKFLPATDATAVATADGALEAAVKVKVGLQKTFMRFELNNGAKFVKEPTLVNIANADGDTGTATYTVAAGGAGESYVVFTSSGAVANTDKIQLATGTDGIKVTSKDPVTITYRQYEDPQDANSGATAPALDTKSGVLLNFVDGLIVTAKENNAIKLIDVTKGEKLFVGDNDDDLTFLLNLDVAETSNVKLIDGSTPATATAIAGTYTWEISGDFGFAEKVESNSTTMTISTDKKIVTIPATNEGTVRLTATGTDVITAGSYNVTLKPDTSVAEDYKLSSAQTTFTNVATLKKSGAQADIDLALSPVSTFEHYVRITNDSSKDGKVFVRVFNDQGVYADLTLADLGQAEALAAGNSAKPVSVKQIYQAALLKNSTLASDYIGMLRLEVTSELPSIDVQSYSVSTDANANSFNVFN